jgi:hypothetical protein
MWVYQRKPALSARQHITCPRFVKSKRLSIGRLSWMAINLANVEEGCVNCSQETASGDKPECSAELWVELLLNQFDSTYAWIRINGWSP